MYEPADGNRRIIFSSAFRRLQDKTQVFPLAKRGMDGLND